MIYLRQLVRQQHSASALPAEVRRLLGKPLRRSTPLAQLAVAGVFASLPDAALGMPLAMIWQSSTGLQAETLVILDEVCNASCEPMPYDFLACQPAMVAAQINALLPSLQTTSHLPLEDASHCQWGTSLALASLWLQEGRYPQVLCGCLEITDNLARGDWLLLATSPGDTPLATMHQSDSAASETVTDSPDFPARLEILLAQPAGSDRRLRLQSPALPKLTVEFAR